MTSAAACWDGLYTTIHRVYNQWGLYHEVYPFWSTSICTYLFFFHRLIFKDDLIPRRAITQCLKILWVTENQVKITSAERHSGSTFYEVQAQCVIQPPNMFSPTGYFWLLCENPILCRSNTYQIPTFFLLFKVYRGSLNKVTAVS